MTRVQRRRRARVRRNGQNRADENEETITRTKAGAFACDNCYDPNDSEQQEQGRPNYKELKNSASIAESTQNTSNFNSSNSFTHEEEKASEKAIEINAEELNQAINIPKELNIIDCPPDVNPDPE